MTVRVVLKTEGVRELLRSPDMLAVCVGHANKIAARAGEGFEVDSMIGRNRARATVGTATVPAMIRQARDHVLERSI